MIYDKNDPKEVELDKALLAEACRIGDQLLAEAQVEEVGISWKTMGLDEKHETKFDVSESIYSGVSGISLFLLELYVYTGDQRYLEGAKQGMKWVEKRCQDIDSDYYSFYTGRMGVSYAFLRMYARTGESSYLKTAQDIARSCRKFLEKGPRICDLLNGISGTLLGLIYLHAAKGEDWILELMDEFAGVLLEQVYIGRQGAYWDRSPQTVSGLCGLSHGASGIGLVLLELGSYLRNRTFYEIAEQAFLYERYYFIEEKRNWPDLRRGIFTEEDRERHRKAYLEGDFEYFTGGSDMNAWCHGAAGIAHARFRALQLLERHVYIFETEMVLQKAEEAANSAIGMIKPTFTLCHGKGGNVDLVLEYYRKWHNYAYLDVVRQAAREALDFHKAEGKYLPGYRLEKNLEDSSLFMGNAGIGYFYLRVLSPVKVPPILTTHIDYTIVEKDKQTLSRYKWLSISSRDLYLHLLGKVYPRTAHIIGHLEPEKLEHFLVENKLDPVKNSPLGTPFREFVEKLLPGLAPGIKERVEDIFELEKEKEKMEMECPGHSLLNIKAEILREQAEPFLSMGTGEFMKLNLGLEPTILVTTTQWAWPLNNRETWVKNLSLEVEPDDYPVLLKETAMQLLELELSPFSYTILGEFYPSNSVEKAIKGTIESFESLSAEEEEMLKERINQQVKQFLQAGILVPVDKK